MSLYRNAKFFTSGSILVIFFYIILGIFSYGFTFSVVGKWDPIQILYAPIILGLAGMGKAALNLSKEKEFAWEHGKQIALFIFVGSGLLLLGLLLLIITTWIESEILVYLGDIGLILSCFAYAIGFFFFQRQLSSLYLKRVIVKYPKHFISIGFGVQSLAYTILFINWFVSDVTITATIVIVGIVMAAISILLLIVGFIQINIAFRAYPHLIENEEIRPG